MSRHFPRHIPAILLIALGLCVSPAGAAGVLNVYNWADYIGEDTIEKFEAEFDIKVNYDVYDSSDIVDAKLLAGNSGYDVVIHAASNSAQLIPVDIFMPLNRERLPNWENLDPNLLASFERFDPGNRYGLPYMWGTTGFSYNREMLLAAMPDAPLNSATMIFEPEVISRFADCGVTLLDSASEVVGMAMLYLGHDANSVDPLHLAQAEQLIRRIAPYIKYYSSTKLLLDLPSQEVCIAMSWSGDYSVANRRAREAGIEMTLGYNIPTEGALMWFDAVFIPSDAPNPEAAHQFLDFLLRPDIIADISNFTGYANANRLATPLVDPVMTSDPAIYPDETTLKRLSSTTALHPKFERLRSRIWTRIKAGL